MYASQSKYRLAGILVFALIGCTGVVIGAILVSRNCVETCTSDDCTRNGSCTYSAIILTGGCVSVLLGIGISVYVFVMHKRSRSEQYLHMTAMQQVPPPNFYGHGYAHSSMPPTEGLQSIVVYPPPTAYPAQSCGDPYQAHLLTSTTGVPATGIPVGPPPYQQHLASNYQQHSVMPPTHPV